MKYDLNRLNSIDFEDLVQSLSKRILGNGTISFGEGTDGGREAEFEGSAPFPSSTQNWDGYWVIQAKFKTVSIADEEKDFDWVKTQLKAELEKYGTRKVKVKQPDNYLLFTNVVLTAKAVVGGRDKANKLQEEYEKLYNIKHIRIISCDDIIDYLNLNRELAITYSPFILPGDVLSKLLELLDVKTSRALRTKEILLRFLEQEFLEDMQAKLDHAGKVTSDKVNLEQVFIDLYATFDGQYLHERKDSKFISSLLQTGNAIIKGKAHVKNRYVLIAGPGYGKSTLTQYLAQTYRAFFLSDVDTIQIKLEQVSDFIATYRLSNEIIPKWIRLPIRIVLKEYAGWINERNSSSGLGTSVLEYITYNVNRKSAGDLTIDELENILHNLPSIFIFDGLDEVPASSNRATVLSAISFFTETILRRIDADTILIATTRPQGYSKDFDSSRFLHLQITDLDQTDCLIYLQRLLDKIIDNLDERQAKFKILKEALSNLETARLMKSPLQASIMAILVKTGGNPPRNKFDLFTNYYDTIFRREKQRGVSRILNERADYVHEIHNRFGFYLQAVSENNTNPSATISKLEFTKIVNSYLEEIGLEAADVNELSGTIIEAATDRLVFISERQDQKFGFDIRSLQEYFAALGYLHNVNDKVIRKRLISISESSYWSNTLLFAIGFIAKNKIYMTDFIESLCYELNGSADENDKKSLKSIVKIGSWLALDILNEGVFSNNPRIENKFCKLLEPLLYVSRNEKHKEIRRLPARIIEKWVYKFLQEALDKPYINSATLDVCINLEVAGYNTISLIEKSWPVEKLQENRILKILLRSGVSSEVILEKFLTKLQTPEKSLSLDLFPDEQDYNFLMEACELAATNDPLRNILFEIIFVSSLTKDTDDHINTTPLFILLGLIIPDHMSSHLIRLLRNGSPRLTVKLVDGYEYGIIKTRITNEAITIFHAFAKDNGVALVEAICDFLIDPTATSFENLKSNLDILEPDYRRFVVQNLKVFNSFFSSVFTKDVLVPNWSFVLDEIESLTPDWLVEDTKCRLEMRKYAMYYTFSAGNDLGVIDQYVDNYLIKNEALDTTYVNFFRLVDWSLWRLNDENLKTIKEDNNRLEFIKTSISKYVQIECLYFRHLPTVLFFLDLDEASHTMEKGRISSLNLFIPSKAQARWTYDSNFKFTFKKIIDLINIQIINGRSVSYKVLLQHCILGFVLDDNIEYDAIPFSSLAKLNTKCSDDKYKAIILLMNRSFNDEDYLKFANILAEEENLFEEQEFVKVLLFILRFGISNSAIEKVFVFLESKIKEEDNRIEFETLIKNYVGSQPSSVEI